MEAIRTVAEMAPDLFREIVALAFEYFEKDRISYHILAEKGQAPNSAAISDDRLPGLLDDFHFRQILHVTYGLVPQNNKLSDRLLSSLKHHQSYYTQALVDHFKRHIVPFREKMS